MASTNIEFPEISVTEADKVGEFQSCTLGAIYGVRLIRALPTDVLLQALKPGSAQHEAIRQRIQAFSDEVNEFPERRGMPTNPAWVTGVAAEELGNGRNAISLSEMDRILGDR